MKILPTSLLCFIYLLLPSILVATIRAPGRLPPEDFSEVASGASIVIKGAERRGNIIEAQLPDIEYGDYGSVTFIEVDEVLASGAEYVENDGKHPIPRFITLVNYTYRTHTQFYSEWPSILFLRSVFKGEERWVSADREKVKAMAAVHNLEIDYIFELVDPEFGVFPLIPYESFDYPARGKYPDKRIWDLQKERLQKAWGLDDFTEIDPFVRKALLPFFEQVDTDWFIRKSGEMGEGEPLRRVGEALVERFDYEEKFKPTSHQHRKAIRVPFVAGSVLTNENLTGDFSSFGSSDENQNAKEAEPE